MVKFFNQVFDVQLLIRAESPDQLKVDGPLPQMGTKILPEAVHPGYAQFD